MLSGCFLCCVHGLRIFLTLSLVLIRIGGFSSHVFLGAVGSLSTLQSLLFLDTQLTLDEVIIAGTRVLESANDFLFPIVLLQLDLLLKLLVPLELPIVLDVNELLL